MRKFILGDIHGSAKALIQVFEKSKFDFQKDKAIFLGDICDGWSEVKECIDFIQTIPNKEVIMGNHDEWAMFYYKNITPYANDFDVWRKHGGLATIQSLGDIDVIDQKYVDFLSSLKYYHEEDGNLFIHAGLNLDTDDNGNIFPLSQQHAYFKCWGREFIYHVYENRKKIGYKLNTPWKEIFVGHSPTTRFNPYYKTPKNWLNVWNMDTGSAFMGNLSMMNIDTKEVFQSDECMKLYPNEKGRNDNTWNEMMRF